MDHCGGSWLIMAHRFYISTKTSGQVSGRNTSYGKSWPIYPTGKAIWNPIPQGQAMPRGSRSLRPHWASLGAHAQAAASCARARILCICFGITWYLWWFYSDPLKKSLEIIHYPVTISTAICHRVAHVPELLPTDRCETWWRKLHPATWAVQ